ncbi:cap-specific mRNA (nucleoside-2'-O-)-methyltransferase 2 [Osmia bicornis bicornis]|uniref:cap-specific mRNA (nucleoside-2'-O-)-methyltransferase 2 n=1 Tax=Osmia bicornis bicornis TaxID=1437191 RepID=UPI0010F48B3A|nr:cap-specific mRNA (nucleoside-2'-O-)-methyltransferase 2 [Osmia bicornis bicornis]XP_029040585.1 cap-specific mRNA (nucleoside-2'-O-)-methyltransferase 2 [Osmia bicornis bicornis]
MEPEEHMLKTAETPSAIKKPSCHNKHKNTNEYVNNLFKKHFSILSNEHYSLPEPKAMFKDNLWKVEELQMLKDELNNIKSYLDNYDAMEWQAHTRFRNIAKDVMTRLRIDIEPELLTQAWCKFYEIVSSFPLVPVIHINRNNKYFKSIHLCEAPGAFITSLNHWLKTNIPDIQWNWIATTLNPYYEGNLSSVMIDDDRFIRHTLSHWCFGEDNTGNIMNLKNLDELMKTSEPHHDIFLITADGSIDCTDVPAEQESVLTHLHFCETVAALHLLATGGSFLLKIFTIFECNTVCLIYLLSCCFNHVDIIKPITSKEGNSETYMVCTNFKGPTFISPYLEKLRECYEYGPKQAIFSKHDIPRAFIEQITECSRFFKTQQCLVIENNIITFKSDNRKMLRDLKQIQHMVADKYIKEYNLKKLESGEIVGKAIVLGKNTNTNEHKKTLQGSYHQRREKQHLAPLDRLENFCNDFNQSKLHISSSTCRKFEFTKRPESLHIRSGKIFHRAYNSKFCSKSALKVRNGVDDILVEMGYKIQFPSTENIRKLENKIFTKPQHKILIFFYTDEYDSHEIISKIYDTMQHLNSGENLVLIGYSLLTYLNVGLLCLLSSAFSLLKIKACDDVGLKITLKNYNSNLKTLEFLHEIKTASLNIQKQGRAILEIIPVSVLYEGFDLCYSAEEFNHWVIKTYINYVLCEIKENIVEGKSNT